MSEPADAAAPAYLKAHATGRWAETMFRALSARVADRWRFVSFRGAGKGEWRGVVDLIAIRKATGAPAIVGLKRGDLFDIVLVQIKGGSARTPAADDLARLRRVARYYHARTVVQFRWRRGKAAEFARLDLRSLRWRPSAASELFG